MRFPGRRNKFGNERTVVDGIKFASKKEARYWVLLKHRESIGEIELLRRQVPFDIIVNGFLICRYIADYTWVESDEFVVGDAKGVLTDEYKLKKKLLWATHRIAIKEF